MTNATAVRVGNLRWHIVGMLVGFSVVSYIERMNISVAAEFMMPELGITQIQMGQVFSAFLLGYALLQIPMGMLGDKVGSYVVLASVAWIWALLTLLTGLLPGRIFTGATGTYFLLIGLRFTLGASIAAVYPMCARTVARWQPVAARAFSYSFVVAGVFVGAAITPPAIAWLMANLGWRESFYLASSASVAIAVVWTKYGASRPEEHPGVTSGELALIRGGQETWTKPAALPLRIVLRSRSMMLLSASYFLAGYVLYVFVFWFYIYLVEVRGFGIVESGFVTSAPFIAAAIVSPLGGKFCDWGTVRWGARWGRRAPGLVGPGLAAVFLFVGARTGNVWFAVVALTLSFAAQEFSEGAYWATTMDIGGSRTGMATGILNTANNLGGVVSTALIPVLVQRWGWQVALDSCVMMALLSAALWLGVDAERPLTAGARATAGAAAS